MAVAAKRKTTEKQFHNEVKFFIKLNQIFFVFKGQIFWKGHKIWKNMPLFFEVSKQSGIFFFKIFVVILEYLNLSDISILMSFSFYFIQS
jgi:hypothetical protein